MEEISTPYMNPSRLIATGKSTPGYRYSSSQQGQVGVFAGRLINFLLELIHGRLLPVQKSMYSQTVHSSAIITIASSISVQSKLEAFVRLDGEPPDIPEPSPPGFRNRSFQSASNYFAQQTMNEQIILTKPLHKDSRQVVADTGGGSVPVRTKPPGFSRFLKRLSSFVDYAHSTTIPMVKGAYTLLTLFLILLAVSPAQAQVPTTVNLRLHKTINNQSPVIGDIVTYTVVVANAPGSTTATNVTIKDELPAGGVTYVPASASVVRGTGSYSSGVWRIASIAPGDSVVLVSKATVNERGVWFNTAEVASADQTDSNSIPNNQSLTEDDYDAVCFSVPILWYAGDEYTVTIPSGYDQIVWYRNDVAISTTAVSTSLAEVNSDFSLTIKSPGVYRFVTYRTGCPATNCCDIQVIQGPYGSLGDYVFIDSNKDGAQTTGEPGINGVKVYLYDETGTTKLDSTVTSGGGKYLFDSLTDGKYVVQFISPSGYQSTTANAGGVKDDLDSDAGVNGFTGVYTIDTSQPTSSTARNNPTVDAGFYLPTAGLGDYVFYDTNKNGIQDAGEAGIAGVVATLYVNNVASLTTLTNASGFYSFTGLTPGSSNNYVVGFTAPSGFTATLQNAGSDDTKDSDADLITGRTQSVTLANGEFNPTLDAGFYIPGASLGDFVFVDTNKNGVQEPGEPGIAGVVVTLVSNGTVVASTTTNASGIYSFTGLTPGVPYSVSFTTPTGYVSTSALIGGNDGKDSDADPITGQTRSVTLAPGENNPNLDAGFYLPTAGLGDYVFYDTNKNGIQDAGEAGIAGVVATLYVNNVVSLTTLTNASGFYSFTGLTPGSSNNYVVGFTASSGYTATLQNAGSDDTKDSDADLITGKTQSVTLANGEFNPTLDAGFYIPGASLGDFVFVDTNKNGVQEPGEPGIAGVVVVLLNGANTPIASTTTNASGIYSFTGLTPGVPYSVSFATPTGYVSTSALIGGNDGKDSDADPITGKTRSVTLAPGENNPNLDAGFYLPTAGLGDYVFYDTNKNGIQDAGEAGIAGVVATLYVNNVVSLTTLTNASGFYSFTGLTPGSSNNYVVGFTAPSGFTATLQNVGADDTKDSDADLITGRTQSVTLANGEFNSTLDAGFYIPGASLGDFVFVDTNKDGIQEPGEPGIAGVVVTLVSNGTVVASTTTNASGIYSFTGLTPGVPYSVSFTTPTGYTATLAQQGGNDTKDSDVNPITGQTRSVTLAPGENNPNLDAGFFPTCPTNFSLVVSNDMSICNGDKATLTAWTTASYVRWYLTPYDGTAFDTLSISRQSLTVSPTTTTVYYAEAVTQDGSCVSARKPVVVSVTTVPTPICLGNIKNTCPASTVDLTKIQIENHNTGLAYEWYTSMDRSVATRVTNLTAVGGGKFYLFAKSGNCYSNPTVLTVEIVDCNCQNVAGVNVGPGVAVCSGDVIPVKAVLSGSATSVVWATNGTGTFSNPASLTSNYTPSVADIATGNVMLTATTNDPDGPAGVCQSATSSLIAQINKRPETPVNVACDDTLVCQGSSTKLVGFAPGSKINWYDQDGKLIGTTQSGSKLVVTPTKTGSVVYYAEAFKETGCVSDRSSITLTVGKCSADLAVVKQVITPGTYSVGQKITYSITVSNNGPITANSVKVDDMLPATLTYVSSTPAGQYNPATGIWTIGLMSAGSDRNLLVEATIIGTGSVKNTAIVRSPDNDPTKTKNDTSSVTIPVIVSPCAVLPPTILCSITEICKGGTTTLTARGCTDGIVKWSDGQTGVSISVTPGATTTYSASCVVGKCISDASNKIKVTILEPQMPTITASADNVCPGSSVILTASGCAGGTIEWSDKAQTGLSIVVMPTGKTTYTAQCRMGTCLSTPATKTIEMSSDIPTPSIVCSSTVVCPGETITLTVENCLGTPVWNSTTATTSSIVVTPTVGNNTYSVYCKNGACVSKSSSVYTINIVAPVVPTVTASADSVCAKGAVVLTATGCNGTVIWNVKDQTGPSITVYPTANISYFAQCQFRTCLSAPSKTVAITVVTPTAPIISVSKTLICSGEKVTLTAKGCAGTVQWHGVDKVGASIDIYPTATTEYYATCKQGTCESEASNKVRVTVNTSASPAPVVTASTSAACDGGLVSLTATGCEGGSVKWSDGQTGSVVSVTATSTNHEFYALCQIGTQCGTGKSNIINIKITPIPTPTVTCSTDKICPGETVTLTVKDCLGTPHWSSTTATTGSIVVAPTVTTAYTVFCSDGTCTSATSKSYTITVTPVAIPTVTASATAVNPGSSVTLTASGCNGDVIWSANDINGNNKGAVIVVQPNGTQTYYAQCKYRVCLSDPSVTITINQSTSCVAKAGTLVAANGTVCGGTSTTVTIAATPNGGMIQPAGYSVLYVLTKGADKVVQQTSATPQFTVSSDAADYTIHTLVYNANAADQNYIDLSVVKLGITKASDVLQLIGSKCAALDVTGAKVKVSVVAPPTLSASSLTVCSGSVASLTAIGCESGKVSWSDGTEGAVYSKAVYSNQVLTAVCTVDGCTSSQSSLVNITLGTPAIPIIVSNVPTVCVSETVSLTATGCAGGTYIWSDDKTVGSTLTITPTSDVSYRVKCKVGECTGDWSAYTTIKVGAPVAPTISIAGSTANTSICYGTPVTLVATGCSASSYVTWSNNQVGSSITVTLASSATFTAQCCNSNQCKSVVSNALAVTVLPKVAQPIVVDKTNACPFKTVDLATAVTSSVSTTGGVLEYYTDASLSSKVATPAAVGTGTYYVVEKTTNGCVSLPVAIHVQINTCVEPTPCDTQNPATANAGIDASVCVDKAYQLAGSMGGAGKTAHWTTSGNGSFDNSYALNAVYTASNEDILSGKVTLTLSVSTNNAACAIATDAMLLTINGIKSVPVITVVGATKLCYGDSVTLKAPAGAAGYKWSNNATTQSIVVKTSGVYTVQLFDATGCSSVKSEGVTVNVAEPVLTPLVSNLRNTCPAKIVDLTKALASTTPGSSYIYRICECNTSNIVMRPDSVCEGTYWIVEKSASGCVSAPAKVVVKVFNCAADTLNADVSIAKTVSNAFVKNGAPVTYTITVSNAGPHTARNIDVRDILPKGLELLPVSSPNYKVSNGAITKRIDSLKSGESAQLVFAARVTVKGQEVVNKAEITYLDNKDTNLANNTASVTVKDTSSHKASLIGLAKAVLGKPTTVGDSLIKVSYSFVATNFGDDTLRHVKVGDDLAYAFAPNSVQSANVMVASGSSLKADPTFTGMGATTQLLDSTSYILPGASQTFVLNVTVKRAVGDTTKSFRNIAAASAINSLTTVTDLSTSGGDSDPDNDRNPTNNTGFASFTLSPNQPQGASIGLALAVVNIAAQPDSSYNITYKATIKNFGDVELKGIVLTDSLIRTFASPTSYSVVGSPVVSSGSTLIANAGFNGNTTPTVLNPYSYLAVGAQDTVLFTVNVKTNGNNGPFYSSASVVGCSPDSSQIVKDISNNGLDPAPAGSASTTVRFDLPKGLLGVSKFVGVPRLVEEGVYDIPYTITLSNMGSVPLKKVQVVDNLSEAFGHGALIVSNQISVTSTGTVSVNPAYTGQGLVTNMLVDSSSTLAVGAKSNLSFTVRVNVKNADSLTFYNVADATALTPTNEVVTDMSTAGINNDPDNDLDPRNNSKPTPIALNALSTSSYIGLAMSVRDTLRKPDGSFDVTYQIVVKNYGSEKLNYVSVSDSLSKVFNSQTGATFSIAKAPYVTSTGSALKLNPNFNGGSDPVLILGDSISVLAAGKVDTLQMVVNVATDGSTMTFLNSAYATAKSTSATVSDVSTSGLNPDLNGNNNPTDSNERESTPLNLPHTLQSMFIPEGFSPNGDGVNDLFVIRGVAGLTVSLEVYNRWGHIVYKNDDYQNDWDGKPNTGIAISSDANGVPDGTYYYVINTSDGRKFVRYMTINR
ncbi:SdrD B-like domain-containing protein [Spirosoma pollinicola]|uniref:DUF11 domain-containing protein n=1 Tax=Spirosoma pollinicola TaxID=2057025 RepID=A0A2K8YWM4_9BACT|nr:SdrD B-like domain-containing protein [Spirosoma pollinicola]AUD02040.1 hypothetical protein CWM47_09565 [Spirosoma pollinicola]